MAEGRQVEVRIAGEGISPSSLRSSELANVLQAVEDMITNANKHTEDMIHLLECSGGLNSHNGLVFKKIELAQRTNNTC